MPERVTTGSEPRRTFILENRARVGWTVIGSPGLERPGEKVEVVEVESGHDEQTERLNTGEAGDIADEFMAAQQAWQPDPRTVAAVVKALREEGDPELAGGYFDAANFIEALLEPREPREA